jgi:hypothetical protein
VTEPHTPDNVEFGEDRLKTLLSEVAHLSADDIRVRISAELNDWIGDAEQYDDPAWVVMKVHQAIITFLGYCELSSRKVFLFSRSFSVGCTRPVMSVTRDTRVCSPGVAPVHV